MAVTKTYTSMIITPIPADGDACWTDVIETCDSKRDNLAGTACIVKWQGTKPASLPANTERNHADTLAYLVTNTLDWDEPVTS